MRLKARYAFALVVASVSATTMVGGGSASAELVFTAGCTGFRATLAPTDFVGGSYRMDASFYPDPEFRPIPATGLELDGGWPALDGLMAHFTILDALGNVAYDRTLTSSGCEAPTTAAPTTAAPTTAAPTTASPTTASPTTATPTTATPTTAAPTTATSSPASSVASTSTTVTSTSSPGSNVATTAVPTTEPGGTTPPITSPTTPAGPTPPPSGPVPVLSSSSVRPGGSMTVTATGFGAGESVTATQFSTPLALGTRAADAAGSVSFTWTIRADETPGTHRVVLIGEESGTVSVSFEVLGSAGLPETGTDATVIAVGATALLIGGAVLVTAAQRRRPGTA